jgi:hypothetical protein
MELLEVCADCYEGYLATGLKNYLLIQKPALERWMLRRTGGPNKQAGWHQ